MTVHLERELAVARAAAEEACAILREHYAGDVVAHEKPDHSPVTAADLAANAAITARLRAAFPGDALLSEETGATPGGLRRWLVDPLDGTRDFIAGTGDFAVHIALVDDGVPVLGVVGVPVSGALYTAVRGGGAFREEAAARRRLAVSTTADVAGFRAAVGGTATPDHVRRFLDAAPFPEVARIGASLKLLALAEGRLEVCLWLHGREHLWDTCAPEVIVREAGGTLTDIDGAPLDYRGGARHARGVVASNGRAHARVVELARGWFAP